MFKRSRTDEGTTRGQPSAPAAEDQSTASSSSASSLHNGDIVPPPRSRSAHGSHPLSRILTSRTRSRTKSSPTPASPAAEEPPPLPRYTERQVIIPSSSSEDEDLTLAAPFLPTKLKRALEAGPPLPAVPDELAAALAQQQEPPGPSTSTTLPALPTYSPLQMPSPSAKLKSKSSKSSLLTTRASPRASPRASTIDAGLGISTIDLEGRPRMGSVPLVQSQSCGHVEGRRHSLAVDRSPRHASRRGSMGIEDELEPRLAPPVELAKARSTATIYHDATDDADDDREDDPTASWTERESFTHDLLQRRRYLRRAKAKAARSAAVPLEDEVEAETESDSDGSDPDGGDESLDQAHLSPAAERLRVPPSRASEGMQSRLAARQRLPSPAASTPAASTKPIRIPPNLVATRQTSDSADGGPRTAPLVPSGRFPSRPTPLTTPSEEVDDPLAMRGRSMSDGALATTGQPPDVESSLVQQTDEAELASVTGLVAAKGVMLRPSVSRSPTTGRSRSGSLLKEALAISTAAKSKAELVIAVVGPKGVGKSTIIARGLRKPTPTVVLEDDAQNKVISYVTTMTVSGSPRTVEILEVDAGILKYTNEGLAWPAALPSIDGAMLCYDATNADALPPLRRMLSGFWIRGGMTIIVLATKSRTEEGLNRINPNKAAEIANVYGAGMVQLDGGLEDEGRKMKNSFHWIVRTVLIARGDLSPSRSTSRPGTSLSMASSYDPHSPPRRPRAQTESASPQRPRPTTTTPLTSPTRAIYETPLDQVQAAYVFPAPGPTAILTSKPTTPPPNIKSIQIEGVVPPPPTAAPSSDAGASIRTHLHKVNELDLLFPKDEIIDKFLFAAVTGNDDQFVTYFLIIFRRFARPYEVLSKLLERYDFVTTRLKSDPVLSRYAHMRLCGALAQWLDAYPGDFVAPPTYALLKPFLENLILSSWVAHYAVELLPLLKLISESMTPEGPWALPDTDDPVTGLMSRKQSLAPSLASSSAAVSIQQKRLSTLTAEDSSTSALSSRNRSISDVGTTGTADSSDRTSASAPAREGRKLAKERPSGQSFSLLDYSNVIAEAPEEAIAVQITRIAWDVFADIKPRDLLRYVMAPRDAKNPGQAPQRDEMNPVSRSIRFVNFLSDWVATLILVQTKLKARARLIEKFIAIAAALRDLENFDSLMGVLAGLNSQPVFRLDTTLALVKDKPIYKRFRSLNRLMATSKGFAAYRLAISTSSATMLPYLGCHLQDITRVCEGKTDMRNGLVNWTKFSQLARCASIVVDCGRVAPALPVEPQVERLVTGVPVLSLDDDSLYSLSYSIQPRGHRSKLRKLLDAVGNTVGPAPSPDPLRNASAFAL